MITLIAQSSNYTNEQLGLWVAIAVAILASAVNIKQLVTRKPPLHREFASKVEHDKLEQRVVGMDDKFEQRFREFSASSAQSRKQLYMRLEKMDATTTERIDALRKEIKTDTAGTQNRMTEMLTTLARLEGKLERHTNPPHST